AHQRICAVDRFANSYQEFLLQQLGISACFSPQKSDITSNIRFGSPCKLLSGVPPTNFAFFYLCISALMSERTYEYVRASNGYERLIGLQTLVRSSFYQFCIFLPVYICTEVRLLYLFRLTEVRASNGYERLIGLQTPGFLPVSPHRSQSVTTNISYWSLCSVLSGVPPTIFAAFYLCFSAIMSGCGSFVCSGIPSDMSKHC
ncbi:hypothetical protein T09_1725, partial [Trichinella sp. T9]